MLDLIPFLASTADAVHETSHEAATGDTGLITMLTDTFGVNIKILIAQMVNFSIVAYLLWRFAFKPVMATMEEREQTIAQGLTDAEKAKQQLESAEIAKAEKLKEANTSAQKILQEARTQAEEFGARQKETLEGELVEKRRRADEAIELEREKALNEARADIARLVVLTSGKVLKKELSDEERGRLNAAATRELASAE